MSEKVLGEGVYNFMAADQQRVFQSLDANGNQRVISLTQIMSTQKL